MGRVFSVMFGSLLALWIGWILVTPDEAIRITRAGAPCGGIAKITGSMLRMASETLGEELYDMHESWSAACQSSIWFFFDRATYDAKQRLRSDPFTTDKQRQSERRGITIPRGDERL